MKAVPYSSPKNEYENMSNQIAVVTDCMKVLSDNSDIDHPLCSSCPEAAQEYYREEIRLAEEAVDNYSRLLGELSLTSNSEDIDQLEQELADLKKEEESLTVDLSLLQKEVENVEQELTKEKERETHLEKEEREFWESFNDHQRQQLELRDQSFGTELQLQYTREQLSRLKRKSVLNTAFYISHNGHFATINGLRFGKLPSIPVSWTEINAAWGQTTLLLYTLGNICGITFNRYKLIPYGSQSFIQDNEGKKKTLPLHTSARIFSDSKYDLGMVAFLDCLDQFKTHVARVSEGRFILPYHIDKEKIGDGDEYYSIKVQFNTEEKWTKALKFTLTNIRWGMTWVSAHVLDSERNTESSSNSIQ